MTQRKSFLFIFGLLCVYALAALLQSQFTINWDTAWDIDIAKKLLNNGNYHHDFFDLNPPLIIYLLTPVLAFQSLFNLSSQVSLDLYIFLLSIISLFLCHIELKKIYTPAKQAFIQIYILVLACIYLLLPLTDFGEREHLLVMFAMPYILLCTRRLTGHQIPRIEAITIGIFAGIGFAIKPYFILVPLLIELHSLYFTRKLFFCIRPEFIIVLAIYTSHFILTFFIHSDYFSIVAPTAIQFYYGGFTDAWSIVLVNINTYFLILATLVFIFISRKNIFNNINSVIFTAFIAYILIYLIQHSDWKYHILPAFSLGILLIFLALTEIWPEIQLASKTKQCLLALFACTTLSMPLTLLINYYYLGVEIKKHTVVLTHFLQEHAKNKSVLFIDASPREFYPAINASSVKNASRFLHMFWLPCIAKHPGSTFTLEESLNQLMIEDIEQNKPDYIFFDIKKYKTFYEGVMFNYLDYFICKFN